MIVTSASDQHSFRSRIESAKADLKRMFSVDVCQQMDILFAEVLHDLELAAYSGGSGSSAGILSSSLSSSQEPTTSYSEDSGPTDNLLSTCYPPSSSSPSEEHEDVLTLPSSAEAPAVKASSAEQPVLSDLPPNDEPVLENCSVVSCCSQESAEEEEEEEKKEEKRLEKGESSVKCSKKFLKNYQVAEEEHDHQQDDVESTEPAFDQLTTLTSQSLSSTGKHHQHQQQFKKLHIESDDIVCPIVWCKHVTYKR